MNRKNKAPPPLSYIPPLFLSFFSLFLSFAFTPSLVISFLFVFLSLAVLFCLFEADKLSKVESKTKVCRRGNENVEVFSIFRFHISVSCSYAAQSSAQLSWVSLFCFAHLIIPLFIFHPPIFPPPHFSPYLCMHTYLPISYHISIHNRIPTHVVPLCPHSLWAPSLWAPQHLHFELLKHFNSLEHISI